MKTIHLENKIERDWLGTKGDERDYDVLIDEDTTVFKPNGDLLCVVLKKALSREATAKAWDALRSVNNMTSSRISATGEGSMKVKNTVVSTERANSAIIGFFERTARMPYCRACAWNLNDPEAWAEVVPLVREVDQLFQRHAPDRYEKQKRTAKKTHPDFLIPGTYFTTLTVNKNFRTAYHKDAGNLANGISCMSVMRKGKWTGANLVFPAYRVAAKLDSFDMIIFDPHEFHGNTPIHYLTKGAERRSVVYYFREKMQRCLSAAEENEVVVNRKQGEQLFKTIIRRPKPDAD